MLRKDCHSSYLRLFDTLWLVYDIDGQLVRKSSAPQLNVGGLAAGVYVVRVIDGNDQYTKKIRI